MADIRPRPTYPRETTPVPIGRRTASVEFLGIRKNVLSRSGFELRKVQPFHRVRHMVRYLQIAYKTTNIMWQ